MVHIKATYTCDVCGAQATAEGELDPTAPPMVRGNPMPENWSRKRSEDLCPDCDGAIAAAARSSEAAVRAERAKLKEAKRG